MFNPNHTAATTAVKATKDPISQGRTLRFRVGVDMDVVDTGEDVEASPCSVGGGFCELGLDERSGEPQRGQDLLVHVPKLEPHEVQNIFCLIEF